MNLPSPTHRTFALGIRIVLRVARKRLVALVLRERMALTGVGVPGELVAACAADFVSRTVWHWKTVGLFHILAAPQGSFARD
jgi:hypothetical protein